MGASDRQIRVFISSTFRDMRRERELLVKQVFPELRRICAQRFVIFTEVDLRWGITEEQAAEGQVLPICLEEIRLSRPYFIGLLGERYGWIPGSVAPSILTKEPWLHEHIGRRTSVTELEILHGVLNNPEMADHAYFYFRDPDHANSIPEKDRRDFSPESAEHAEKLRNLKERIRTSGMPLMESYANPDVLAVKVRDDLLKLINRLYPEQETPDPLARESLGHDSYAERKLLAYVPRPEHTAALDAFVCAESTGRGLVVTGDSGAGKTALLADWVRRWRKSHGSDFLFAHYFGSTPDSASVPQFLHRLLSELKRRFDLADEVPIESDKLREAFPLWLAQTTGKGQVLVVLDAVNQIDGDEPDRRLVWVPRYFPAHVRVLASSLPGPALDALGERGWAEHKLPLPDVAERARMIDQFFQHYRKEGEGRKLRDRIANADGSENPLFLRTVLEELRQFGSFEQLPAKVGEYLAAATPEELFRLVLARWREDFDADRDLVRRALSLLWAARQGLSEVEWRELLGTSDEPLLHQLWSPLFLAMEPHLALRAGLHAFGHEYLLRAVEAEFMTTEADRRTAHLALGDYFEAQKKMSPRKAAEWPWQLHAAESWTRLETALTDLDLFLALYNEMSKWELGAYWLPLRQQGRDMEACYAVAYEHRTSRDARLAYSLGAFLIENGCFRMGKDLTESAAASAKASFGSLGELDADRVTAQGNLALLLEAHGDFPGAAAIRERVLSVYELSFGERDRFTATACINLAGTYLHMGRWGEAEALARRAITIDEQIYGADHPEVANDLICLAESLRASGKPAEAETALTRSLSICRNHLPPKHPLRATALSNLAVILVQAQRSREAEPLALEAAAIDRECLGNEHPKLAIRLNNLAAVMKANGRIRDALQPAEEALKILVAHSVRTGVPHHHIHAAAVTLASLATQAGLAPPLAMHAVNGILRPLQELKQATLSHDVHALVNPSSKSHSEREPSTQTGIADGNVLTTGVQSCAAPFTASRTDQEKATRLSEVEHNPMSEYPAREGEGEISPLSQILIRLDPKNLRYRAEHGEPEAQCNLAVMLESEGEVEQAAVWYRRAAEQGVAHAQFNLAVLLHNGHGVEQNFVAAVEWYEKAAGQGYLNAVYNLAFMRENGYGCARDLGAAFHLYESAANQKEPDSQCKVALLLLDEDMQARAGFPYRREGWDFVPKDHERARRLLKEAAKNRNKISQETLAILGWSERQ